MKRIFIAILFFSIAFSGHAQKKYVDSLKILLSNTTEPIKEFDLLVKIGEVVYNNSGTNVDSLSCIRLDQIAEQLNSDSLLAISYDWIGNYFKSNKGDNTTALEYYFKGLPLAEKVKDKRRISSLYFDIAGAYFNLYNPEEAIKYIRKGGSNLPDPSSPKYNFMAMQFQIFMARYYVQQQQPDSALHFVQALNEINLQEKNVIFESIAQNLFGAVYDQLGDKKLAEIYYQKANALIDSTRFYDALFFTKKDYAQFLLNNNKIVEAEEQARKLFELGRQIDNNDFKLASAGFLRQVYDSLRREDSAYYYCRLELILNDSVFKQANINKIQALAFREQLRVIDEEAKKVTEEEQRKENIQYALIALGIVTLVLFYLLLSRSFITNEKAIEFIGVIALLIVFEFLNLLLHPFLGRITNHSPVWMLLALVCIGGLLVPIHHRLEKWAIKKLVEKNKQIRLASAKKTIEKLEGK